MNAIGWKILKVTTAKNHHYRLIYNNHFDDWNVNSGIESFIVNKDTVTFYGVSGSIVKCKLCDEG